MQVTTKVVSGHFTVSENITISLTGQGERGAGEKEQQQAAGETLGSWGVW